MAALEPAAAAGRLSALISATNPITFLGSLSYRGWFGVGLCALVSYCNWISTLSRRSKDAPCPEFGQVLRVLYGLFGTRVAEFVLGYFLFTKAGEPQPEQNGGTVAMTVGRPELRVEIIPVLGQPSTLTPTPTPTVDQNPNSNPNQVLGSVLGGNYAYLVWDEADPERRALVVDPSDP